MNSLMPQSVEYALRALVCLDLAAPETFTGREHLVEQARLPPAYASKVLRKLVEAGLIEARKGWNGGFRLARPTNQVWVWEVMTALDMGFPADHCVFGLEHCDPQAPCVLHHSWLQLRSGLESWARKTSVAELASAGRWTPSATRPATKTS
jgi:Rrf2 family iron-sulfur cluster assembly transcriptional regulator